MRILHIIASADLRGGGPIEGLRQQAKIWSAWGVEVEVLSLDDPERLPDLDIGLKVHCVGPGFLKYGYSRKAKPWLDENARRFDVVIINGIWTYHSFVTWRSLRRQGIPYFIFTHGMLDPWFKKKYPFKHLKKWLYWPWAEYRVLRDAAYVLFTCEEERLLARKSFWLYRCNERVVKYGTAWPPADADSQKSRFVSAFPATKGKRIILFMSRLHPKKGVDLAIEAFAEVCGPLKHFVLVVAGPDEAGLKIKLERRASELGISDCLVWTGMLRDELKWGAIRSAEVLLLPSHQENFGIIVAEALACGTPALISNKVNIWREVEEDCVGFVANDTAEGAAQTLRRWLALDEDQRSEMSDRARISFEKRFEITGAVAELTRVFGERSMSGVTR